MSVRRRDSQQLAGGVRRKFSAGEFAYGHTSASDDKRTDDGVGRDIGALIVDAVPFSNCDAYCHT